jgi:uncharacterized protein with PQ loop repeat
MHLSTIGQLSLSLSLAVYFIYFLPQIWYNQKTGNARSISPWLQLIYVLGYSTDWLYGATAQLQWQYRCVTLIGMLALCFQQWQMRPARETHEINHQKLLRNYGINTTAVLLMILSALTFSCSVTLRNVLSTNSLGTISMLCSILALSPQLISNYKNKNGFAISHVFIGITLICAVLDLVSAIFLHWPWPSLVSPVALFLINLGCLLQQRRYRRPEINANRTLFYNT